MHTLSQQRVSVVVIRKNSSAEILTKPHTQNSVHRTFLLYVSPSNKNTVISADSEADLVTNYSPVVFLVVVDTILSLPLRYNTELVSAFKYGR